MKRTFLFISISACFIIPGSTFANWGGGFGTGSFGSGHLEAIGTNQVEILNEDLNIELYRDHAKVTVTYIMKNTGEVVTVKAGFPNTIYGNKNEIREYHIEVDGSETKYKYVKGGAIKSIPVPDALAGGDIDNPMKISWFVSSVKFKKGEQKKIAISYSSRYQLSHGGPSMDDNYASELFRYLLSTGSTWKGPIQKGKVTIKPISIDSELITIKPAKKFIRVDNTFTWEFDNLEPTWKDNILIDFNNAVFLHFTFDEEINEEVTAPTAFYIFEGPRYYYASHAYNVKASSTLKPISKYKAERVKDMEEGTAWAEGRTGDGIGEYLLLQLKKPRTISQIGIMPGYAKSRKHYYANNRVAEITAIVNDSYTVTSSFPDEYVSYYPAYPKAYHYIDISGYKGKVRTIKLVIDKVYKGAKYEDTCISEIILRQQLTSKPKHAYSR
ncbi:MAG TPA: hypothetical protein DCO77_04160 [Nitrospiraceae bacterium]|nr:hypothetical protein [Nitrospiraceae bacterium]